MEREVSLVGTDQPMTAQVLTSSSDLSALAPNAVYLLPRGTEIIDPQHHVPITEFVELSRPQLGGLSAPVDAGVVLLQHEFPRWQAAKQRLQLADDQQLATILLDLYEESVAVTEEGIDSKAAVDLLAGLPAPVQLPQPSAVMVNPNPQMKFEVNPPSDSTSLSQVVSSEREVATWVSGRLPASMAAKVPRVAEKPARSRRKRPAQHCRPCPKSKKPGFLRTVHDCHSDGDNSVTEDDPNDDAVLPRLFNYPPVEPELLKYFSCGLCEHTGVRSVEQHFKHLWTNHTEFHMVGGRIQRIPIRLRPQLFVMCALCGLNNRGSAGDSVTYLTTAHLPAHAQLLAAAVAEPLHCDQCSAQFDDRGLLAMHVIDTEHRNDSYRCAHCGVDVEGRKNYISHLHRHYLGNIFQCYFCMALFETETACVSHIKSHHVDNYSVHKCSNCGYATALFHDFLLHVRSHSQLNRHVCHVCGVTFVSKMSLKHHIPTHSATQFPCDQCGRVFAHPQTQRRHVLNAHHNPDKCTCKVCGRQFGSAFSMRRHHMIHTGERPYQCDKCGRGFVQKGDLEMHHKKCSVTEVTSVYVTV